MDETSSFFASTDWAVVLATLTGPVAAVAISIWLDKRARERERRLAVINMLIHGAVLQPLSWNQGMLQLPLEFGRHDKVMDIWEACNKAARDQRMTDEAQEQLIKAAMSVVGFSPRLAGQAVRAMYRTIGVGNADQMHQNALLAVPEIAAAAGRSAEAAEHMLRILHANAAAAAAQAAASHSTQDERGS